MAREVKEDGWCYYFIYERMKDGYPEDSGEVRYQFYGVNLRYRFSPEYIVTEFRDTSEHKYIEKYSPRILRWGSATEAQKHDSNLIYNEILDQKKTVQQMLAINPDQYEFEDLDKDMFFRLMHEALTGETAKETTKRSYADKPSYSMMIEPEYIDGYKFQIAFIIAMGFVEEIYIDVIYQTGQEYVDYVQLSDMVDEGKANAEQKQAFEQVQLVANAIRGTDDFLTEADSYKKLKIGEIDFARLYEFVKAIDANEYQAYLEKPVTFSLEEVVK